MRQSKDKQRTSSDRSNSENVALNNTNGTSINNSNNFSNSNPSKNDANNNSQDDEQEAWFRLIELNEKSNGFVIFHCWKRLTFKFKSRAFRKWCRNIYISSAVKVDKTIDNASGFTFDGVTSFANQNKDKNMDEEFTPNPNLVAFEKRRLHLRKLTSFFSTNT